MGSDEGEAVKTSTAKERADRVAQSWVWTFCSGALATVAVGVVIQAFIDRAPNAMIFLGIFSGGVAAVGWKFAKDVTNGQ